MLRRRYELLTEGFAWPLRPRLIEPVRSSAVRLIVARCEVRYTGRLTAVLRESTRLLMFKSDGSVLVHADAGGYKPLNCDIP
jgi:RecB family endonuclease NucS